MSKSLIGKKIGMSQYISDDGTVVPVTICELGPCVVIQKKTVQKDGYSALKFGYQEHKKEKNIPLPQLTDFKKKNISPKRHLSEVAFFDDSLDVGSEVKCSIFQENETVTVTGISKGRGFAGVVKMYGFAGGKATHGSHHHRAPGSIGANTFPAEVWKGKKMPGRFGSKKVTVKNLKIVKILQDKNIVLISGAVPGRKNSIITVTVK